MLKKINRRDLLKNSLLLSTSILLGSYPYQNNQASAAGRPLERFKGHNGVASRRGKNKLRRNKASSHEADVLVIGAGAAGLAAARALQEEDYEVIILEARDRIGGRVWTNRSLPGLALDMGASWIHGIEGNPLTDLAQELDVETAPTDYDNVTLYNTQGEEVSAKKQDKIDALLEELLEELDETREELDEDMSLQEALDEALAEYDLSAQELRELTYAINTTLEHEYAADIADLSLFYWDEGEWFDGGDVLFPNGYDQLMHGLAAELDIRLEQVVQKIEYDETGVEVMTNQGVFEADHAVITLPLGVLKRGSVTFAPALPTRKLVAIRNLGMGLLNKLYLRFPEVFWDEEADMLGYISKNKGEWNEWLNIYKYTGQPVLLGFNAAVYGRKIETLSDKEIVEAAMTVLRTIYGNSIPKPTGWLMTRWAADPFAGGSYSYLPPGATPDDYDALAKPVGEQLFFAGEATFRDHSATVHGALLSGRRAAKQIARL